MIGDGSHLKIKYNKCKEIEKIENMIFISLQKF